MKPSRWKRRGEKFLWGATYGPGEARMAAKAGRRQREREADQEIKAAADDWSLLAKFAGWRV